MHKLIKSLSKSEKGYFLKFAKKNALADKQYLKLFKAIDIQEGYDEKKLKDELKAEAFVQQLHVAKKYLFKMIMKVLYLYESEHSLNYKFSSDINIISNLYNRGLYKDSLKYILKSKEQAYSVEKFDCLLELIRWEKYIVVALSPSDISENLEELCNEETNILNVLSNLIHFRKLHTQMSSLMRTGGSVRAKNEESSFEKIINDPLLKSLQCAMSYEAKLLYHQVYLIYFQAESNDKNTYEYSKKFIEYMITQPQRLNEFAKEYILGMVASLSSSFNLGKYEEANSIIKNLRKFRIKSEEQKEYIFFSTYILQFMISIVKCEFENIESAITEAEIQLKTIERKENNVTQLILYQDIFYVYFALEKYDKSLEWLNKILSSKSEVRQDIHSIANILNLIVHYELNNLELLNYAVINTYRFLYKRKRLYKFEEIVLKFIRKISKTFDIKEDFRFLRSQVLKLADDPYERIPMEYFDFISWLDSKISGKSFLEMKKLKKDL
ncbi:MAG: hypothetical protein ABI792_03900 [bacterium]